MAQLSLSYPFQTYQFVVLLRRMKFQCSSGFQIVSLTVSQEQRDTLCHLVLSLFILCASCTATYWYLLVGKLFTSNESCNQMGRLELSESLAEEQVSEFADPRLYGLSPFKFRGQMLSS